MQIPLCALKLICVLGSEPSPHVQKPYFYTKWHKNNKSITDKSLEFVLETQWSCFWQQANVHLDFHPILDKNVFIFFCSKTKPYNLKNSNDDQVTQIQNTQSNLDAHSLDVGNL